MSTPIKGVDVAKALRRIKPQGDELGKIYLADAISMTVKGKGIVLQDDFGRVLNRMKKNDIEFGKFYNYIQFYEDLRTLHATTLLFAKSSMFSARVIMDYADKAFIRENHTNYLDSIPAIITKKQASNGLPEREAGYAIYDLQVDNALVDDHGNYAAPRNPVTLLKSIAELSGSENIKNTIFTAGHTIEINTKACIAFNCYLDLFSDVSGMPIVKDLKVDVVSINEYAKIINETVEDIKTTIAERGKSGLEDLKEVDNIFPPVACGDYKPSNEVLEDVREKMNDIEAFVSSGAGVTIALQDIIRSMEQ